MTRALTVLYVENDAALLGLLGNQLGQDRRIARLIKAKGSSDALSIVREQSIDVALLDISLGSESQNGVDLARSIRALQEHCGIVLLSQNLTTEVLAAAPSEFRYGWSGVQKTADLSIEYLIDVLQSTARGLNVVDPGVAKQITKDSLEGLSSKQRHIMSIAATGVDATEIANQLGLAAVTVRQELSRIYKVLVPQPKPGTDLRTTAVLNYLRLVREQ
jgi:two-component system response regulator DesR